MNMDDCAEILAETLLKQKKVNSLTLANDFKHPSMPELTHMCAKINWGHINGVILLMESNLMPKPKRFQKLPDQMKEVAWRFLSGVDWKDFNSEEFGKKVEQISEAPKSES